MKNLLLLTALGVGAWWLYEKSKSCKSSDEMSLDSLRKGIANGSYDVYLWTNGSGKYFAIITDTESRAISQATYEALKADGVTEV